MSDRESSTGRTLPSIPTLAVVWTLLALTWSAPWLVRMWNDVMAHTDIGQGLAGPLSPHDVGEVIFVAAYGGIRLVGGLLVLTVALGAFAYLRRRRARRASSPKGVGHPQPVAGD